MAQLTVESILKEIEALSEDERNLLEERLAKIDEAKWQQEAAEARLVAANDGINQAHIDQTIEKLRRP